MSPEARHCFNSRASKQCFGVIKGVCSILPEGSAAWRIKSPTCLCFADLCCPGNRCRDFPFLHFFSLYTLSISLPTATTANTNSTRCCCLPDCFLPHDLPHSTVTYTRTHTLCTQFPIHCSHLTMSQDRVTDSSAHNCAQNLRVRVHTTETLTLL